MKQSKLIRCKALRRGWSSVALVVLIATFAPLAALAQTDCDRTPILVRNARLWNPSGKAQDRDVLFEGDRVTSIVPAGSLKPGGTTRVVDGKGQTLLPGLVDLHLHFGVAGGLPDVPSAPPSRNWEITGRQLLRSGVTSGRIHLMSLAGAALLKRDAASPCSALPRLQFAGPGMAGGTPETESPNYVGVKSAGDAAAKVRRVAEAGLEWIAVDDAEKFLPGELKSLTMAARNAGIRLMGGVGRGEDLEPLLSAGVDTYDYFDGAGYPDTLLRRLKESPNATLVPIVGYHYRLHEFDRNPRLLEEDSNFEFMSAAEKAFVLAKAKEAMDKDGYIVNSRRGYKNLEAKFRQLLSAGIPMATGTDVGSAAHFHAGAIWWELEAWRTLGASAREALTAATATGARVLRDERAGTLKEGSHADFVLYSGDIEQGSFNLERVRAVAKGGVLFVRDGVWVGPRRETASPAATR